MPFGCVCDLLINHSSPDFLIVDWPELTLDEKKSHFALWSSFSAPLIISAYIPDLTEDEIAYLSNEDIIAVDQDALAQQATLVSQDGYFDVLTKSLANGDRLLTVLNKGDESNTTSISTERMGLEKGCSYSFKDLWTGETSQVHGEIDVNLDTHATAIYRISGVDTVTPTGMIFNTASMKCMTVTGSAIKFTECDGSDEQVWQISTHGKMITISPLSSPNNCLAAHNEGTASLSQCDPGNSSLSWTYHITGNLINGASGECLQQNGDYMNTCQEERDSQVFGLPSGVRVIRGKEVNI